jgi:hypothetical protein
MVLTANTFLVTILKREFVLKLIFAVRLYNTIYPIIALLCWISEDVKVFYFLRNVPFKPSALLK